MKNTKTKSNKQEKKVAREIGGSTTIASGALYIQKADVRSDKWLCECKTTDKEFYSLKESIFNKVYLESVKDGLRLPVMNIDLAGGTKRLAVIRYLDFIGLDLDCVPNNVFVGDPVVKSIDKLSYRLDVNFFNQKIFQDLREYEHLPETVYCRRQDIQFKGGLRLVILEWEDFIRLTTYL